MKNLITIILLLLAFSNASAQFEILNTNTTLGIGKIIKMGSTLILSGYNYSVKTTDTGKTFIPLILPTLPNYNNTFIDVNDKLFLTSFRFTPGNYHLQFFCSNDTGLSWQLRFDTIAANFGHQVTIMSDSLHGVMASLSTYNGIGNYSLRTQDGGYTWIQDTLNFDYHTGTKIQDSCILLGGAFVGPIAFSRDYGLTWRYGGLNGGSGSTSVSHTKLVNKDTIYAIGQYTSGGTPFMYSFDGLVTQVLNSFYDQTSFAYNGLDVLSKDEIYSCGKATFDGGLSANATIMKTTNLGVSWELINTTIPLAFDEYLFDILFLNDSIAHIAGSNGLLLKWNKNSLITSIVHVNQAINNLSIYPNPANDFITIKYIPNATNMVDITIQDELGRTISEKKLLAKQGSNPFIWDISNLASGLYFVTINEKGQQTNRKFIKQ